MTAPAEIVEPSVPEAEQASFPLVVVRVGEPGSLRPPPPSSRARPRVNTLPGLGTSAPKPEFEEVDELLALCDEFYFAPGS